jgi:hypothetical protein
MRLFWARMSFFCDPRPAAAFPSPPAGLSWRLQVQKTSAGTVASKSPVCTDGYSASKKPPDASEKPLKDLRLKDAPFDIEQERAG